jgi:hypothetical protein
MSQKQRGFVQSFHAQVLGEVLIRLGAVTREQLERALKLQRASNLHIGEAGSTCPRREKSSVRTKPFAFSVIQEHPRPRPAPP